MLNLFKPRCKKCKCFIYILLWTFTSCKVYFLSQMVIIQISVKMVIHSELILFGKLSISHLKYKGFSIFFKCIDYHIRNFDNLSPLQVIFTWKKLHYYNANVMLCIVLFIKILTRANTKSDQWEIYIAMTGMAVMNMAGCRIEGNLDGISCNASL